MSLSLAWGIVYAACLALSLTSFSQHPYAMYVSVTEGNALFTPAAIFCAVEEVSIEISDCGSGFGGRVEKEWVDDLIWCLDEWFPAIGMDEDTERGLDVACKSVGFPIVGL